MVVDPHITAIEQRAKDAGIQMTPVLRMARVAPTTWWRWRSGGVEPKLGTLRRVSDALDSAMSQRDTGAAA